MGTLRTRKLDYCMEDHLLVYFYYVLVRIFQFPAHLLIRAIIPLMQSYVIAAHFHWHQKLIRALIENSILYGVGAIVCLGLAIWLIVKENLGTYVLYFSFHPYPI